jgi:hypothetical protein
MHIALGPRYCRLMQKNGFKISCNSSVKDKYRPPSQDFDIKIDLYKNIDCITGTVPDLAIPVHGKCGWYRSCSDACEWIRSADLRISSLKG